MPEANDPAGSLLLQTYLGRRGDFLRFFTARCGSETEAEDILQDLYLKVSQADGAGIANCMAYIYRLGINLMVDRARSARRRAVRDNVYRDTANVRVAGEDVVDAAGADDAVHARLVLDRVLRAVDDLPPQCKRVFRMHKLDGLSYAEVAAALGISRSAVEKHMFLALRRLSAALPATKS